MMGNRAGGHPSAGGLLLSEAGPYTQKTREPAIVVSPFGDQSPGSPLWLLTADEAEQLAGVMLQAVKETRELFLGG
jgi:hypothetical protein